MSIALVGLGMLGGGLVYYSVQAMNAPIAAMKPTGAENFAGPMNIQTWQSSASPINSPNPTLTTAEMAPAAYATGMSPIQKLNMIAAQATNAVATNNEAIRLHMMNAGDPVVIGPNEQRSVVLTSQYEQNAYVYNLRKNLGTQGPSANLMRGDTLGPSIPGSYTGDQSRPSV